jgi:hypothetical protein
MFLDPGDCGDVKGILKTEKNYKEIIFNFKSLPHDFFMSFFFSSEDSSSCKVAALIMFTAILYTTP